jgi:L-ascorbate metabolism protein UlaG (beta-lactamase superfamily)
MPFPVSDHCDGTRFFNPRGHVNRSFADIWRWKRSSKPAKWPAWVEIEAKAAPAAPAPGALSASWINHSSFLLQGEFGAMLTDPVYSPAVGLFGRIGPKRTHAPGIPFETLPRIGCVLLSHDHYDHCDLPTLARLAKAHDPLVITPLGNGVLARRAGLQRVVELDWWQSHTLPDGTVVTLTPSRHWSNRLSGDRNGRLWGGFYVRTRGPSLHFVGDTGYDQEYFNDIRGRLGAPDLALVPIGAYEPRWFMQPQHCSPEEAVRIHSDLGARQSVAMHWGCWQLTDEPREEPPGLLSRALREAGIPADRFRAVEPGETVTV